MKMKIYLVVSAKGVYREKIEKAFTNKEQAQSYADELNMIHHHKEIIPYEKWLEIEKAYYKYYDEVIDKFCRENNIPTQEEMQSLKVYRTEKQIRQIGEVCDKLNAEEYSWWENYIVKNTEYTKKDYEETVEYHRHLNDQWKDARIEEVELIKDYQENE